ncbi:MAG: hypothetical protein AAGA60_26610 [Cyanobacteria bacterium P01_E01_bin.42]
MRFFLDLSYGKSDRAVKNQDRYLIVAVFLVTFEVRIQRDRLFFRVLCLVVCDHVGSRLNLPFVAGDRVSQVMRSPNQIKGDFRD